MDDSFDGFLPSRGHEESNLEGDPVRVDAALGSEQGQDHQVMKPACHRLAVSFKPGRWIEVSVEQVRSDHRLNLETNPFRFLGDIDQHPVVNGLLTGVAEDQVPIPVTGHLLIHSSCCRGSH